MNAFAILILGLFVSLSLSAGDMDWPETEKPDIEQNDGKPEQDWPEEKPDVEQNDGKPEQDWPEDDMPADKPDIEQDDWDMPEDKPEQDWPEDEEKPDVEQDDDVGQMPGRSGCWVKMYDREDLKGEPFTFYGNLWVRSMDDDVIRQATRGRIEADLENEIDSLEVGPGARLTVYDDTDFEDDSYTFGAGFVANDLDEYPVGHNFESFKLRCR